MVATRVARRALALAALALAVLAAGAQADTPYPPLAPGETVLKWQLLGVGADGHSLTLWVPGWVDRCGLPTTVQPRADFQVADAATIEFRLVRAPDPVIPDVAPGIPGTFACPAIKLSPRPLQLPLPVAVRGQQILGADRFTAPVSTWNWLALGPKPLYPLLGHATPRPAPDLVGLRLPDALGVLSSVGVPSSKIKIDRARHGDVIDQSPRAGQPVVHHGRWMVLTGTHHGA
jgi:hypothetical protein